MKSRRGVVLVLLLLALCVVLALVIPEGEKPGDEGRTAARDLAASGTTGSGPGSGATPADGEPATGTTGSEGGDDAGADADDPGSGDDAPGHDFEKESPFTVSVRVLDSDGRAVKATVKILDPDVEWAFGRLPERGPGAFTGYLPEAGKYAAEADIDGTLVRSAFAVSEERPEAIVMIGLPGSGSVSGSLHAASGVVSDDVKGTFRVLGQTDLTVDLVPDPVPAGGPFPVLAARVTPDGRYRISGVPSGAYLLRVKNRFHAERIEVGENEHLAHDVLLGGGRIHGRVTEEASGRPLVDVQVVLQFSRDSSPRAEILGRAGFSSVSHRLTPDEDGRYAFPNLPLGDFVMFANGVAYAPLRRVATLSADAPEAEVDFPLVLGSSVDIRVDDLDGAPLEGPLWLVHGIRCGFVGQVGGLRAGTHDFTVWAPGHEIEIRRGVVFAPGKPTELRFRLAPAAVTKLVFRDTEGEPVPGVRVSVLKGGADLQVLMGRFASPRGPALRESGADGVVEVRGARAGPVRVVAKKTGFALIDRDVALAAERETVAIPLTAADTTFTWRVTITSVSPGSPADRLGLQVGDVLRECDGETIDSSRALAEAVRAAKAEGRATMALVVERAGETIEVAAEPGVLGVRLEEIEVSR